MQFQRHYRRIWDIYSATAWANMTAELNLQTCMPDHQRSCAKSTVSSLPYVSGEFVFGAGSRQQYAVIGPPDAVGKPGYGLGCPEAEPRGVSHDRRNSTVDSLVNAVLVACDEAPCNLFLKAQWGWQVGVDFGIYNPGLFQQRSPLGPPLSGQP